MIEMRLLGWSRMCPISTPMNPNSRQDAEQAALTDRGLQHKDVAFLAQFAHWYHRHTTASTRLPFPAVQQWTSMMIDSGAGNDREVRHSLISKSGGAERAWSVLAGGQMEICGRRERRVHGVEQAVAIAVPTDVQVRHRQGRAMQIARHLAIILAVLQTVRPSQTTIPRLLHLAKPVCAQS